VQRDLPAPPARTLNDRSAVFVMSHGLDLPGQVVDPAGSPITGAEVTTRQTRVDVGVATDTTGTDGRFRLRHMPPGGVILTVSAKGYAPVRQTVPTAAGMSPVSIVLSAGKTLRGRVVDPQGLPVMDAAVTIYFWNDMRDAHFSGKTDSQGRFQFSDALSGDMECMVSKQGYQMLQTDVRAADNPADLVLTPEVTVSGTVADAQTHEPIARFRLMQLIATSDSQPQATLLETKTYYGGTFNLTLGGESGDTRYVRILADGYAPADSLPIRQSGPIGEIDLRKAPDLHGRLLGAGGNPLPGATIFLSDQTMNIGFENGQLRPSPFKNPQAVTDADGRFSFPPQLGSLEFWAATDAGCACARRQATEASPVEMRLLPWAAIHIHGLPWSLSPTTTGVESADPSEQWFAQWSSQSAVGPGGDLLIEHVPPFDCGRAVVSAYGPVPRRDLFINLTAPVTAGQTTDVQLGGGLTVTGRLSPRAADDPVAPADVAILTALPDQPPSQWPADGAAAAKLMPTVLKYYGAVSADGRFSISGVAPGAYAYHVYFSDGTPRIADGTVRVAASATTQPVDIGQIFYSPPPIYKPGLPAPPVLGRTLDDKLIHATDFAGNYIVWAAWGADRSDSTERLATLGALGRQYAGNSKVTLLAINFNLPWSNLPPRRPAQLEDGWVNAFLSYQDESILDSLYDANAWPPIAIIAPDGAIAAMGLRADQVAGKLASLLAAK
jgi:uncharacterized GH25 family protein